MLIVPVRFQACFIFSRETGCAGDFCLPPSYDQAVPPDVPTHVTIAPHLLEVFNRQRKLNPVITFTRKNLINLKMPKVFAVHDADFSLELDLKIRYEHNQDQVLKKMSTSSNSVNQDELDRPQGCGWEAEL